MDDAPNPSFPWMTARQGSEMLLNKPKFISETDIEVTCPDGSKYSILDRALEEQIENKFGYQISLKHAEGECQDSKPVSILGLQTVTKLGEETGIEMLAPERFRANIYVNWKSGEPFVEDAFLRRDLKLGDRGTRLRIVKKDSRCVIPTLDPFSSVPNPLVFETIKTRHGGCFGVYAEVISPGIVEPGDEIYLV